MNLLYYPHLPLKSVRHCVVVLQSLGVTCANMAALTGYTGPAFYKWKKLGASISLPALNTVNELTYRAALAYKDKKLPVKPATTDILRILLIDRTQGAPDLLHATAELLQKLPNHEPTP